MTNQTIRLTMLHAAPKYNDIKHNIALLEGLFMKALDTRPDLVITPELAVSGYEFLKGPGTAWIKELIPEILDKFCRLARDNNVALILGSPQFDDATHQYYNAAIFIDENGRVIGAYHKINVLPGSEAWASPGRDISPILWNGHNIGLLICADAYTPDIAAALANQRAEVLISPAAWAPGFHGPNGEWEQRSKETGLCLYVCNRTGPEKNLNFEGGSSAVIGGGQRLVDYSKKQAAILSIVVKASDWSPLEEQFNVLEVS